MDYFRVKNWEKFQHYSDRSPIWIKLYNSILDDYEFGSVSDEMKGQIVMIWLLASRHDNKLPMDSNWIARRIQATAKVDLKIMLSKNFIEIIDDASDVLAEKKENASPEKSRVEKNRVEESRVNEKQASIGEVKFSDESNELVLAAYLLDRIRVNNPEFKQPNLQSWAEHIDRMIRLDKRNDNSIMQVILWCQQDSFWKSNILSTKKLREKYDQLIMRMNEGRKKNLSRFENCMIPTGGEK